MARVDEVAKGVYRICTFQPESGLNFNQFLIEDEHPALIHTGMFQMYDDVRKAIGEVLDPARLRYVVVPHFESDECGGMGRFVEGAPEAVLACGELGSMVNLAGWDYPGPVRGFRDGDTLELGEHTLRFMETPHVHHWDSMMVFEETTQSLFPADLFMQFGDQPPVVRENLGKETCQGLREVGIFPAEYPVLTVVDRVEEMNPAWIHPMHGGSVPPGLDALPHRRAAQRAFHLRGQALRSHAARLLHAGRRRRQVDVEAGRREGAAACGAHASPAGRLQRVLGPEIRTTEFEGGTNMNTQRPTAVTVAAALLALFSVLYLVSTVVPAFSNGVPAIVVYGGALLGLLGLVAAYGLWALKRWGVWLTITLSVLNVLSAAPGIAFAPTTLLFVAALVTVVGYVLIIVLVVMPASRRAYA